FVNDAMPRSVPASSPVLVPKTQPSMATEWPSHRTFLVPLARSDDFAMFTRGSTMNGGVGGTGGGALRTSSGGVLTPPLPLCTTDSVFTPTVTLIVHLLSPQGPRGVLLVEPDRPDVVRPVAEGHVASVEQRHPARIRIDDHRVERDRDLDRGAV